MARLYPNECIRNEQRILQTLYEQFAGLSESEIAHEMEWGRRRLNNYLREMRARQLVYKEGQLWFVEG